MQNEHSVLLVIHPGTLGDVLLALPGVRALKRIFPDHRLLWIGQGEIGRLLVDCQEVDESLSLEGQFFSQLYLPHEQWSERLKQLIEGCTHCVGWLNDPDGLLKKSLTTFGINHVIIQSPKSAELASYHTEKKYLEILEPIGVSGTVPKKRLRLPLVLNDSQRCRDSQGFVESSPSQFIVMHPGSGSLQKCANSSLLQELVRRLKQIQKMTLVILQGPADEQPVNNLIDGMSPEDYCLVRDESLLTVASLLSQAALYIGHDSGITHLASSFGIPCIALFGPTDPDQWAPRGSNVSVIRGQSCQCMHWKEVQGCHPKPCLDISVDLIFQQAERLLGFKSGDRFGRLPAWVVAQEV